jgi:hypothetical protein
MGASEVQVPATPSATNSALDRSRCAATTVAVCPLGAFAGARPDNGSRMRRESHVRFCERAAVRSHRATRLVAGFEREADARRFLDAMRIRFEAFALALHPDKTRLIEFGRFAASNRKRGGLGKPETFDFLGFTFICGTTRAGKFLVKRAVPAGPRAGQAQGSEDRTATPHASVHPRTGGMAEAGRNRLLQLPMQCRPMVAHCRASATGSSDTGCARSGAAASCTTSRRSA